MQIRAFLDDSPLSGEVGNFLGELETLTDRITVMRIRAEETDGPDRDKLPDDSTSGRLLPSMELYREDATAAGISFHGVPGGHEFNSFIIALYNVAGPGQQVDEAVEKRLKALNRDINIKVLVSLSCTMCPEVVMAAQKAAALSGHVTAEMVDLMHYPELKEQFKVMSVPCMVINGTETYFGKKSLVDVADIIDTLK